MDGRLGWVGLQVLSGLDWIGWEGVGWILLVGLAGLDGKGGK